MQLLYDGNRLIVTAEEWVNKLSGRGRVTLHAEDHSGTETVLQEWYWAIFFPGQGYGEALAHFFPWAKMSIDEEFYAEYDYHRYQEECGHYDREDDVYFYHETFGEWKAAHDLSALRPYLDDGEVANWRLTLELNELGKSFLSIHNCRQQRNGNLFSGLSCRRNEASSRALQVL
jgi:hypothetical protein